MTVIVEQGVITGITPAESDSNACPYYIGPGFVDLQVNGFAGIDFNSATLTGSQLEAVVETLWQQGVTTALPTVVTNSSESIRDILETIFTATEQSKRVRLAFPGIHLEGPFISPQDGARGAHPLEHVQKPDWELFCRWQDAAKGLIKLITLSPEWPESIDFIKRCVASGVVVGIGHTNATPEQIQAAIQAGAQLSTHLGNGCHQMIDRHSNYLWEQLASDTLWASLICDGFHLPPPILKIFLQQKKDRAFIVSDSVYLAGMPAGEYHTHIGGEVSLTAEGKLHMKNNANTLAGSAQSIRFGMENLIQNNLVSLAVGWEMGSVRPAALMGLPQCGGLVVGAPADLLACKMHHTGFEVLKVYKSGKLVCSHI